MDHTQIICTSLQTDNHVSASPVNFSHAGCLFSMPDQQCQSTEGNSLTQEMWQKHTNIRRLNKKHCEHLTLLRCDAESDLETSLLLKNIVLKSAATAASNKAQRPHSDIITLPHRKQNTCIYILNAAKCP